MSNPADLNRYPGLPAVMARMAANDPAALAEFIKDYGPTLAVVMRGHLLAMGWKSPGPDEVHDLMMEAVLELRDHAGAWRADGGSLPWWWAGARLRSIAAAYVGQHATDIDEVEVAAPVADGPGPGSRGPMAVLRSLARRHPEAGRLADALAGVASERDQTVFLEFFAEAASGNRSPAVTVAALCDMNPAAVRKVVERVRRRLGDGWAPPTPAV